MRIDGRTLSHEASETIRRLAVQRVKDGERPSDVIKSFGLCRTTIYKWLEADRGGGEEALKARKHPGPEPKLSPTQKLKVRKWINRQSSFGKLPNLGIRLAHDSGLRPPIFVRRSPRKPSVRLTATQFSKKIA